MSKLGYSIAGKLATNKEKAIEELTLDEKINTLKTLTDYPYNSRRAIYGEKRYYETQEYDGCSAWEYGVIDIVGIFSLPTFLTFATSLGIKLYDNAPLTTPLMLISGGILSTEIASITATNVYMAIRGNSMVNNIESILKRDIEAAGYEVNLKDTMATRFFNKASKKYGYEEETKIEDPFIEALLEIRVVVEACRYSGYEQDLESLKELYDTWIAYKFNKETNTKYNPEQIKNTFKALKANISEKVRLHRYQHNNERLLNQEVTDVNITGNVNIRLAEKDDFVSEVSALISRINENPYQGRQEDIAKLTNLASNWISRNLSIYRSTGKKLEYVFAPLSEFNKIKELVLNKIEVYQYSKEVSESYEKRTARAL